MTLTYVALALAVVAVVLLVARQRALRTELEAARGEVTSARSAAEEADRLRREGEASSAEEVAAATARTAAVEEAMGRQATDTEGRLEELKASSEQRIEALERSLHRTEDELRRVNGTAATRTAEVEAAQARVTALEGELAGLRSLAARGARPEPPLAPQEGDAGWSLLLARIERQWAELVNAGPEERGVVDAPRAEQLAQAAGRELERLREEVGVETAMTVTGPVDTGHAVTTLLVVSEAAALLASRSERVSVELGGRTVVTGQEWAGDDDSRRRLDELVWAASAAGSPAVVEPDDGGVRVVLG